VKNNSIFGGFATDQPSSGQSKGVNAEDAIIKSVTSKVISSFDLPFLQNRHRYRPEDMVR
jgi:hypothetical protein